MTKTAFILAAGTGSRMLPLTKKTPKPLLKINGKPMLRFILDLLDSHGFTRVGINVFQFGEQIEKYLKKSNIKVVKEKSLTGTAGGVLAISRQLIPDSSFLVIASDMMVNFDLSRIYKFHLRHGGVATICCYFRPKSKVFAKKSGLVLFDRKTKELTQIIERPDTVISRWINSSVYIFNPEVLNFLRRFRKKQIDIPKDLVPKLLKNGEKIYAYPVNSKKFYQLGIDVPERIEQVRKDIQRKVFVPVRP